jgi:hypothetical protein
MIVRCVRNLADSLPSSTYDSRIGITTGTTFPVTVDRRYAVYAVTVFRGCTWYYILNDDGHAWPTWTPAPLFDITDGSLPASWILGYHRSSREDQNPMLSFPEWATDHYFYERLVDGDPDTVRVFATRRAEVEALAG